MEINDMLGTVRAGFVAGQLARADAPQAHAEERCVHPPFGCGQPLGKPRGAAFRDRKSRAEYDMLGTCQVCQDRIFEPSADEVAEMAADKENFGRCRCGEYREYERTDVGVSVIKGFNCCPPITFTEMMSGRCGKDENCCLDNGHSYGCDFSWQRP